MPRRGSLVGDAYVRIHADSSAMDREIRREARAAAKSAGDDAADEYIKNFDKQIRKQAKAKLKGSNEELVRGIVGGKKDWDRQFKASGMASVDDFVKSASKRMEKIANFSGGKGFKLLPQSLADLRQWADDTKIEEALKRQRKATDDQDKAFQSYAKNILFSSTRMERAVRDQESAWQSYGRNVLVTLGRQDKAIRDQEAAWLSYGRNVKYSLEAPQRALAAQDKAFASYEKNIHFSLAEAERRIKDQDVAWNSYADNVKFKIDRDLEPRFRKFNRAYDRLASKFVINTDRMGDRIGRMFGKGSRNNFFNAVGSIVGGISTLSAKMTKMPFKAFGSGLKTMVFLGDSAYSVMQGLGQLFTGGGSGGLIKSLKDFGGGIGDIASSIGGTLLSGLKAGLPMLVAFAGAMTALAYIAPAVLALVANLAGILIALAGTISIGLAGALLALAPIALAAFGGILAVVGVIQATIDKTKEQQKAMKPLSDAWARFMKILKTKVAIPILKALGELAPVIDKILTPAMEAFGKAIEAVTLRFAVLLTDRRMQPFLKMWSKELPEIFRKVGTGIADLLIGFMAFMKPLLPFADRLANLFERLSSKFLDWTTSAEGQNSIKDFMDRAWSAGKQLWDLIFSLGEAVAIFFDEGDKHAGKSMFDGMIEQVQTFVNYLKSPEGQKAIGDFFDNAKDTAKQLWQSLKDIGTALSTIDWKQAGDTANTIIDGIGKTVAIVTIALAALQTQTRMWGMAFSFVGDMFRSIYNAVIGPTLSWILGGLSAVLKALAGMFDALSNVPGFGWAKDAANRLRDAAKWSDELGDSLRSLPDPTITVRVGIAGEGARLLRAGAKNTIATRRADTIFGAASGGILDRATFIRSNVIAGEAGREAIVPLDRPLSQIDPSVRALAAVAQNMDLKRLASGSVIGGGGSGRAVVVEAGAINVVTPNSNPVLVAEAVVDRLAAAAMR